ncbi:MAG: hypothetical protein U5K69_07415 [Balneolaceae bacterium]|nr:hypothetical protein [Balneolaceae bacterium]
MSEVEQHFGITIEASEALLNTTLSGSISLENREKALNYLALSLDAELSQTAENRYTLTENGE